ncbi:hypothetical protein DKT77_00985 [Meridianimarinicoccus roseus]|uniref:Cytochrome P450 n=1 Tax=Meridianimarinicoccus roseus TaxID=2072018 RepID=A0A2V2LI21_9RHOB|nr:hypothetical protein [Meridianimarinicoccus roseus]PWR04572.1 hypothetical protein DKT77_00985 [Meridianimarinicoccus roseus]
MTDAPKRTRLPGRHRIDAPDTMRAVLLGADFNTCPLLPYLDALREHHGMELPHFRAFARYGMLFQNGADHLAMKRAVAPFLTARRIADAEPLIDAGIEAALARLRDSAEADLFTGFCEPAGIPALRGLAGLTGGTDAQVQTLLNETRLLAHGGLSPARIQGIEVAMATLDGFLAPAGQDESTLVEHLRTATGDEAISRAGALAAAMAAHSMVQTLARSVFRLLLTDPPGWRSIADNGLCDAALDRILLRDTSSRIVLRIAARDTAAGSCPVASGDTVVLDVAATNARHLTQAARGTGVVFGIGPHKCPGEHLARAFTRSALPRLARAFPRAALHRDRVKHFVSPMVRYPSVLPAELKGRDRRVSSRMVEVLEPGTARRLVNDDRSWGPPPLDTHLRAVQQHTGTELGPAIRIARNAMFFMSGPRHAAARREVAAVLGGNRITAWQPLIDQVIADTLDTLAERPTPDLIADFADPLFRGIMQPLLGVQPNDRAVFDAEAPLLQDVLEPWLPMRSLLELQKVFDRLLGAMQDPKALPGQPQPLLGHLLARPPEDFDADDCKALVLVLYGASFNLVHTLGNVLHHLLAVPGDRPDIPSSAPDRAALVDGLIAVCASPKYIYRVAREDGAVNGIKLRRGDTLRVQLLSVNRDAGTGHLAFGHGLHRCVGAAATRHILRAALPALFERFPGLDLIPGAERYHDMTQTIAPSHLPCTL